MPSGRVYNRRALRWDVLGWMLAVTACLMMRLLYSVPITLSPSVWYAGRSYLVLLAVTGLAVYGFTVALDRASGSVESASAKAA